MRRLSLTARLSLLFMLAVAAVLSAAGLAFSHLSEAHFRALDQHTLLEKLQASQNLLGQLRSIDEFEALKPQLRALLGAHRDITAIILEPSGRLLFADPAPMDIPQHLQTASQGLWSWQERTRTFSGVTGQARLAGQELPLTVMLVLDVTHHLSFFDTLRQWFWIGLVLSALASAGLGWLVARSGLRPLHQVTRVAASISAESLHARIPMAAIPQELQQLVTSFNAMLDRLDAAFVRLSNFSADIAHELRTPVGNLMTHTEVVLSRPRSIEDYQENLHANLDDLQRMARMIDDMLFLAKADNGLIIPERRVIALEEVVEKLFDYYRMLAEERAIELRQSGRGTVQGDVLMLRRAISNLLSNALRYTPAGRCIEVSISQADSCTRLSVGNPGDTVAAEHLGRLFDRFYRVDLARREGAPSNAGLGLAITRSIVEAHRGRIWCTSAEGLTTFHLEFPCPQQRPDSLSDRP